MPLFDAGMKTYKEAFNVKEGGKRSAQEIRRVHAYARKLAIDGLPKAGTLERLTVQGKGCIERMDERSIEWNAILTIKCPEDCMYVCMYVNICQTISFKTA